MSSSSEEENYWPGYVDALTTMTMVLTFIMLVLGLAVFSMSQNISKGMLESIAKAIKASDDIPTGMTSDDIAKLVIERIEQQDAAMQVAQKSLASLSQNATIAAADGDGISGRAIDERTIMSRAEAAGPRTPDTLGAQREKSHLRLIYKPRATGLDEAARNEIASAFATGGAFHSAKSVEVVASVDRGNPAITDAQRIAYYRAFVLRDRLIESGIPAAQIKMKIEQANVGDEVLVISKM